MIPVSRPDGAYHTGTMTTNSAAVGINQPSKCLALCIENEITRLGGLINALPAAGGEAAMKHALDVAFGGFGAPPVNIPAIVVPPVVAAPGVAAYAGFVAGGYPAALNALPAANQPIVDNYFHYLVIRYNLDFNFPADAFQGPPQLMIADIPYAISAMQDTRIIVGAGSVYSTAAAVATGAPPPGAIRSFTAANIRTHINSFYTGIRGAAYAAAQPELVNVLGPYCAYCGSSIKNRVEVEHLMPKGRGNPIGEGFSSFSRSWLNFLPSCSNCNTTKGSRPTKSLITNPANAAGAAITKEDGANHVVAAVAGGRGDQGITDKEYLSMVGDYFLNAMDPNSYQNEGFRLVNATTGLADNTAIAAQVNWVITQVNEENKYVSVNVGVALPVNYIVEVDVIGALATPLHTPVAAVGKVGAMINICGINTNANADRRTVERTETWFMALASVNEIVTDLAGLPGPPANAIYVSVYETWKKNLIKVIKEKGFLSVWLKIFSAFPHPLVATPAAVPTFAAAGPYVNGGVAGVNMNLVQDIAQTLLNSNYFPNTNWANVP
ncbi:MAG: hypothetical protein AAFQ94_18300 [Bacteroidota bacterium]